MEGLGGLGIVIWGVGQEGPLIIKKIPGKRFCIPQCLRQVTGGSVLCSGIDRRFSQATESRWGSCSFKAHQRAAPGQQEDEPTHWSPGKLQLG